MVFIGAGSTGFCIDMTEVTGAQYAAFISDVGTGFEKPAGCESNTTLARASDGCSGTPGPNLAAAADCLDWCDAAAYCAWAGKRLCVDDSEWEKVCTTDGSFDYPYGDVYEPLTCNGADSDGDPGFQLTNKTHPPGTFPNCHGQSAPYDQVLDLSGNVTEWVDSCVGTTGASDSCTVRGGGYGAEYDKLTCASAPARTRNQQSFSDGFRCCADP
jgi:formylglycine-generating enzyme required for sulfatase activity